MADRRSRRLAGGDHRGPRVHTPAARRRSHRRPGVQGVGTAADMPPGELRLSGEPLVDFSDGELDLLLSHRMLGRLSLLLEVGLGKAKRFELSDSLGIDFRAAAGAMPPLVFPTS